jgi:hypothetical protein
VLFTLISYHFAEDKQTGFNHYNRAPLSDICFDSTLCLEKNLLRKRYKYFYLHALSVDYQTKPKYTPGTKMEHISVNLITVILLLIANGFFVAAEFSLVKARGSRIETLAKKGSTSARLTLSMQQNLEAYSGSP